jgi:hypothetical protein
MKSLLLVLSVLGTSLPAQRRLPWTSTVPALSPGDRVRVWAWEYGPQLRPHEFVLGTREMRIAGELILYHAPDSVRIRSTGLLAPFFMAPERTIRWDHVSRIDRPNGRDVLGGAGRGLAMAFGAALMVGLAERAFGCQYGDSCGNVWKRTARYSVVTVPAGTALGFFSTKWERVY